MTATLEAAFAAFDDPDEMTRLDAGHDVQADTADTVERLVALLADPRPRVRATAAYTLGQMATQVQAMSDEEREADPALAARAAKIPGTLSAVHALFDDPDAAVRSAAYAAVFFYDQVQRDRDRWFAVAVAGLDSDDAGTRATAAHAVYRFDRSSELAAHAFGRILREPERPGSNDWQEAGMMLGTMEISGMCAARDVRARLEETRSPELYATLAAALDAIWV